MHEYILYTYTHKHVDTNHNEIQFHEFIFIHIPLKGHFETS